MRPTNTFLHRLNSLTKYPSIPTYHMMGDKGMLQEARMVDFVGDVIITEKVDGTNGRIVFYRDLWLIGSREEWLYAKNDLICNPVLGIVEGLHATAKMLHTSGFLATLRDSRDAYDHMVVAFYFEVYGGKIGKAAKQYSSVGELGRALFDVAVVHEQRDPPAEPTDVALWRSRGGQKFVSEATLQQLGDVFPLTPRVPGNAPPERVDSTADWLKAIASETDCKIDGGAGGAAEGVVVRYPDRSMIAKLRHQDYQRTLKRRKRQ